MRLKFLPLLGLIIFCMLSLADLSLTGALLHYGNGKVYEANPIAAMLHGKYGFSGLAAFKITTLTYVGGVSVIASRYRLQVGLFLLTFACLAVGLTVVYSVQIVDQYFP
jgi:hypothetical protein